MGLNRFLTVDDFKRVAERRVPRMFFQYADSGAYTEHTYQANSEDFHRIRLQQRIGVDITVRSLETTILGRKVSMPLGLAPTGAAGMQTADGEIKAARAAEKFGIPFTLSTVSICSMEDIAAETKAPFWFQLYVRKDREFTGKLIDRAKAAGCSALVVTMDCQHYGQRHKDVRNGLTVPLKYTPRFIAELAVKPGWSLAMLRTKRRTFGNFAGHVPGASSPAALAEWMSQQDDLTLNWKDLHWIKQRFGGPLVVKGVLHPDDAREAVAHGADAIIVSNHGGRQLDGAPSTIRVLPRIVDAVGGRCEIYLDSGVRSGHDMIKAVALGARAVFIGRPFLYALGVAGEAGVSRLLEIVRAEADSALGLMGVNDITTLGPAHIESNDLVAPLDTDNATIGAGTIVEPGVVVGFRYHPDCGLAHIGSNGMLRHGTLIYGDVTIGDHFQSGHNTVIRAKVRMGDYCTVTNQSTLEGLIRFGDGVRVMSHVYIPSRTWFGDRVFVGPGTVFLNERIPGRVDHGPTPRGATVENDVMIGGGCTILPGVTIGARSFIAAGTLVTKNIPAGSFVKGHPGRIEKLPPELDCENSPHLWRQSHDLWHPEANHPTELGVAHGLA